MTSEEFKKDGLSLSDHILAFRLSLPSPLPLSHYDASPRPHQKEEGGEKNESSQNETGGRVLITG